MQPRQATRRLSCLRLAAPAELHQPEATVKRLGPPPVEPDALQRLFCVCAPVRDYTGHEVARVGVFGHGADDRPILNDHHRGAWDLGAASRCASATSPTQRSKALRNVFQLLTFHF